MLNPLNTLKRGYAVIKQENKVISSIKNIKENSNIKIEFKDGIVITKVIKVGE